MPLAPTSSKTLVSPSIRKVERLMKITVENALPDCGRHLLQWHSAPNIGLSEIS